MRFTHCGAAAVHVRQHPCRPAQAAEPLVTRSGAVIAPGEDVSMYPQIQIRGGWHPLLYQSGPREGEVAFSTGDIASVDIFLPLLWDLLRTALTLGSWDQYSDIGVKFVQDIFGDIRMNAGGTPINEAIGCGRQDEFELDEEGRLFFSVDWRLDPWDNARLLEDCIIALGAEKVNLASISGGGQVLLAYLARFGTEKLASIFFNMSLHNGTSLFGGLATKHLGVDAPALSRLLPQKAEEGFEFDWLALLLRVVYEIGLLDLVGKWFQWASGPVMDRVYDEAVVPYIFTMPTMWSYVPAEQYDLAKELLLKGDPQYDGLVFRIDRYRDLVLAREEELLLAAASEIKVAVRAGYGTPLPGLTQGAYVQSDMFVDTRYASMGATCAPLDSPFPASYKPGSPFISPDRMVDASTCLLPELTWFAKYQPHRTQTSYGGWYKWFLRAEGDYTVFGDEEKFPQFQFYRTENAPANEEGTELIYFHKFSDPQPPTNFQSYVLFPLLSVLLWGMKAWRFALLLPLFWIK